MDLKIAINNVRRVVMHGLTKYVGFSDTMIKAEEGIDLKRILLCRPNSRLGNQLLITPLVQEIIALFPDCKVDLFARGFLSEIIFENYEQIDKKIKLPKKPFGEMIKYIKVWFSLRRRRYDLVINVTEGSSSGRLSTRFSRARWRFFNHTDALLQARYPDYRHMAKFPVYNFRHYLSLSGLKISERPVPLLSIKLSEAELDKGKMVLNSHVDHTKETICIYTFATGTKCYSEEWWAVMYIRLMETYGKTYNILEVLPIENVSKIHFEACSYYSKNIREIASVIANSVLFLGADSGIMHLAASSGTPTVGLFSITDPSVYRPYGNHSLAINTNTTNTDGIIAALNEILNYNSYLAPRNLN
ncbi:MAG: glycosyltransferase family 9 protein [Tannerellaceae bacterium]|jgi:ADP-heptose:LPS heptosyltransferase|nr:glycosyltransferase family 9 protein [Tannerellaceae bacterium]